MVRKQLREDVTQKVTEWLLYLHLDSIEDHILHLIDQKATKSNGIWWKTKDRSHC